jgi:hypothetical protein
MRVLASAAGCTVLLGCSGVLADGDGRAFGDDMGRFHVMATMDTSTCGPQAMDAPEKWEFDVVLSKKAPIIYWNTGPDAVEGKLGDDGKTFAFTSEVVVNVDANASATGKESASAGSTCTVVRSDDSSGTLDAADSATAFTGKLEYRFAPEGSSDCSDLLASGGFAMLPCSMTYRMTAAWVSAR